MFVLTLRSTKNPRTRKRVMIITAAAAVVCAAVIISSVVFSVPDTAFSEQTGKYSLIADTEEARRDFLLQFGYTASQESYAGVTVPASGGEVFGDYCDMQLTQGLTPGEYSGMRADQYTLEIDNMQSGDDTVWAVLTVYRGRVIAAHLTTMVYNSPMLTLTSQKWQSQLSKPSGL